MIKTAITIEGVNIINFGNTADRYYWCKNIGETTLYVSAKEDISPDADDVAILKSGDIVMIETYNQDIYVFGAGKIQIYETETNNCPFKVVKKGGETNVGIYPIDPQTGLPYGNITVGNGIIALVKTFKGSTVITSVMLPNSLKTIGSEVFYNCTNLKTIDFAQVEEIGESAFRYSGITSAILPETLHVIGLYAFTNCTDLTSLYIPASCTSIGWNAFSQCTALTDLRVGVGFNADLTITYVGNNKLTAETINAIIANYADNSGKTLTIGGTYLAKLSDDDKAVAAAKGLTLA